MTAKRMDYWTVECDFEGCDRTSGEDSDYSAWGDLQQAYEEAQDSGQWLTDFGGKDYCPKHCHRDEARDELVPDDALDVRLAVQKVLDRFEYRWELAHMANRRNAAAIADEFLDRLHIRATRYPLNMVDGKIAYTSNAIA